MNYLAMDLEFNQAFEFDDGNPTQNVPECKFEIIQIGLIILDENLKLINKRSYYIKPKLYKRIHPFVKELTGITEDTLECALTFSEVFDDFIKLVGDKENIFCLWGNNDIKLLYRNINFYGLNHDTLTKKYINVQAKASTAMNRGRGLMIGLKSAIEFLDLPQDYGFHNALNDAFYTAEIFKHFFSSGYKIINYDTIEKISKPNNFNESNLLNLRKKNKSQN